MALFPKQSSRDSSGQNLSEGALVLYEQDGKALLAAVTGWKKQKCLLFNMRGREIELNASRLNPLPENLPAEVTSTKEKTGFLLSRFEEASKASADISIEEIWSLIQEEELDYTCSEIASLYFGKEDSKKNLPLMLALIADSIFFKRKKDRFTPRSLDNVEELKKAREAEELKQAYRERVSSYFQAKIAGDNEIDPEAEKEVREWLSLLEKVCAGAGDTDSGKIKDVDEFLKLCRENLDINLKGRREEQIFYLLKKAKHFHKNSSLCFLRHSLPIDFDDEVLEEARHRPEVDSYNSLSEDERAYRINLCDVESITIDDVTTLDMDDALSIEETDTGYRLGIHISDVASQIIPDSVLDQEAQLRASSVYCPERTVNMFPPRLSTDILSLVPEKPRRCLSCLFNVSRDLQILDFDIRPTLITSSRRYSYDEVEDQPGREGGILDRLYQLAINLETKRLENGALKIPKRMVSVHLVDKDNPGESDFEVKELDESSPARSLIGEMMILANGSMAEFAVENNIPLIFRSQEASDEGSGIQENEGKSGPAHEYSMRAALKRSSVSTTPGPHATLALPAYAQVTSPIRRYLDLCNQRQIINYLQHGEPLYTEEELSQLMAEVQEGLERTMLTTRENRRFWLFKYLVKKRSRGENIRGTVLRTDLKNPLVELDEVYMPVIVKTSRKLKPADELDLKITHVDPVFDYLKLEIV